MAVRPRTNAQISRDRAAGSRRLRRIPGAKAARRWHALCYNRQDGAAMTAATAIDGIPALVLALDGAGRINLWNRRLEELTGFGRDEMLGRAGTDLVQGAGPRPLAIKGGGQRLVRWEHAAVPSGDGTSLTLAVGTDVTDDAELAARVRRADRLAAVGTLASGLAHEVRNPLNAALLQLTLLRRRLDQPVPSLDAIRPTAALVEQELQRLDRMVDDFIAFAQPRPLDLRPTDLASLCRTVAAVLGPDTEAAGVRLELDLSADVPALPADPERLQHVLLNLARNALDAMPAGGDLTLRLRRTTGGAQLEVTDTGHGFPEGAPVFDAFFTTKASGTGLGLSIVHRIVTDHGGTIAVKSRPGNTSFTVTLPAA
jgi:signal transduction histidine kinase